MVEANIDYVNDPEEIETIIAHELNCNSFHKRIGFLLATIYYLLSLIDLFTISE
ncbi:MAG: hypothetical protein CM15mP86_06820 [Gammaproteobacteria bacterium]|nr:MAG: hypothetical protein CM15mP86_06820 [Gammaproteobacteria bacterium]